MTRKTHSNLYELLLEAQSSRPGQPVVSLDDQPLTADVILDKANRFARFLESRGIEKGDTVILHLGNSAEFLYAWFACAQRGIITVLVNPAARRFELKYYIQETSARLVITSARSMKSFKWEERTIFPVDSIILADGNETGNHFHEIVDKHKPYTTWETLEERHPASIIFTSAMDGYALGAELTHSAILETATHDEFSIEQGESFLSVLPLFHAFGLTASFFIPLYHGGHITMMTRFVPDTFINTLMSGQVSIFNGVPVMYQVINGMVPEGTRFPAMKYWVSGGEKIPVELMDEMKRKYDLDIQQGYGLTEASPIVTWNSQDMANRVGSIGKPLSYNQVRIVDDSGMDAPLGQEGELLVKGVNVINRYHRRPDKTDQYIRDGWLYTGDLGHMDHEGYYYITGRKKEMIIRNGLNVYPKEVERILGYHPDIQSICVFPQYLDTGEGITAEITPRTGSSLDENSITAWCRANLSSYKIPDTFLFPRS